MSWKVPDRYISPEMLLGDDRWRDMLVCPVYTEKVKAMVLDEAHCVQNGMCLNVMVQCCLVSFDVY